MRETQEECEVEVFGYDSLLDDIENEFGIKAVSNFEEMTMDKLEGIMNDKPISIDVRGFFDSKETAQKGFYYRTL